MRDSLQVNSASVVEFISASLETVYLNVTLENGITWDESIRSTFYTEVSGSNVTQFKALGQVEVGDKVILLNVATNELMKKEVTALDPVYDTKTVYELDVEEQDIFLSVLDQDIALVQHNPCWCNGYNCGWWSCYNSCWTCQGACFIGEAVVATVDGEKEIKDIQVGDLVQSFDVTSSDLVTKKVKGIWKADYDSKLVIINGTRTKATMGHPFAIKDFDGNIKWAAVDPEVDKEFHDNLIVEKLEVGKYFINLIGNWVLIESIEFEDFKGIVYNISVEDTQNYIAEGILVHNMAKKIR
jgi:intein/homing endonuclease